MISATHRAPRGVALLAVALVFGGGCSKNVETRPVDPAVSNLVSEAGPGPLRMTQAYLAALQATPPEPERVPLDSQWQGGAGARVTRGAGGLLVVAEGGPPIIVRDVSLTASRHTELRVHMRQDAGTRCTLTWASDIEPILGEAPGATTLVFADNQFHTYTLALNTLDRETWAGEVRRIAFQPSDVPATVEIAWLEFAHPRPAGPKRITIANQTHEALFGSPPPWSLVVPPEAMFEVHVGMLERAYQNGRDGRARFRAVLDAESAQGVVLLDSTLAPKEEESHRKWSRAQADLRPYAGEKVRISLTVASPGSPAGAYAYWGNPMVFGRGDTEATPVVLVSWDTVRADHLSCYGYTRETTPRLDEWIREAVLFETAISDEPWTLTAHMSMLTGLYPKNHGVTPNANLSEDIQTLPEVLARRGYLTAGFVSARMWLAPWEGFSHGFDEYGVPDRPVRDIVSTYGLGRAWLDRHPTSNFFLFLHNFEAHANSSEMGDVLPYGPSDPSYHHFSKAFVPAPTFDRPGGETPRAWDFLEAVNKGRHAISEEEADYCVALYDDSIRMIDQVTFELFEYLRQKGLYNQALIIVTADHGEGLRDHRVFGHGDAYEECCHVPLIVKFPNGRFAGSRPESLVQLSDLYPTVLDVLGLPPSTDADGQSLLALLEHRVAPREFAYTFRYGHRAVRADAWKLAHSSRFNAYELFDLMADPHEQQSVYSAAPPALPRLQEAFARFYEAPKTGWHFAYRSEEGVTRSWLALMTEDKFRSASLSFGDLTDSREMVYASREIELDLEAVKSGDEMVVTTASPDAKVLLTVQAPSLALARGNGRPDKVIDGHRELLDPADPAFHEPPAVIPEATEIPSIYVWYVVPEYSGSPAPDLSEEDKEALRALGYVDDVE